MVLSLKPIKVFHIYFCPNSVVTSMKTKHLQNSRPIWDRIVYRHWRSTKKAPRSSENSIGNIKPPNDYSVAAPSRHCEQQEPAMLTQTLTFMPGKAAKRSQSQCDLKLGGRFNFSPTMMQNTKGDNTESGSQGPGERLPVFGLEPFDPEFAGTLQFRCSKINQSIRYKSFYFYLKSNIHSPF